MSNPIKLEQVGRDLIVRFTRTESRSPLSVTVLAELYEIVERVEADDETEKVVFTGVDDVFASGADLREIAELRAEDAVAFARYGQDLMARISMLRPTTIAAVNGFCFGGAFDLALACDRRVAAPTAQFAHPGARLGIITGWGGTQRLPRLIGRGRALEILFTAEAISTDRALRFGLIDAIADDPVAAALEST